MSAILKKKGLFVQKKFSFLEKGGAISPYLTVPSRQHSRVLLDRVSFPNPGH